MLTITKERDGARFTATLKGRIDSMTSPELEDALEGELDGIQEVVFDVTEITYISSAGLRVILAARKAVGDEGSVTLLNASQEVREIFEVTSLDKLITIS